MSVNEHRIPMSISCAIITVSDTRTRENDKSGKLLQQLLVENEIHPAFYTIVKDEASEIVTILNEVSEMEGIHAILFTGGTGISKRDITIETVSAFFEKEIVGFGELFRMLSYTEDIGSTAMLSRASAGVYKNKAIFIMPGSSGAVKLAMNKLILKELGHIVFELNK